MICRFYFLYSTASGPANGVAFNGKVMRPVSETCREARTIERRMMGLSMMVTGDFIRARPGLREVPPGLVHERYFALARAAPERVIAWCIIVAIWRSRAGLVLCVDIVLSVHSGTVPVSGVEVVVSACGCGLPCRGNVSRRQRYTTNHDRRCHDGCGFGRHLGSPSFMPKG
jgi:hypothetical protein